MCAILTVVTLQSHLNNGVVSSPARVFVLTYKLAHYTVNAKNLRVRAQCKADKAGAMWIEEMREQVVKDTELSTLTQVGTWVHA